MTIGNGVTSIGDYAFEDCTGLTSVYISDIAAWCGIAFGGSGANPLSYAHNLYLNGELVTDLVIPDSVTSIGDRAFYYCTGLTSMTIGNGVTSIGDEAFAYCMGLTEINWNAVSVANFNSSSGVFRAAGRTGEGITVTFEESVEEIPAYLFYVANFASSLPNVKSVIIGSNVTSIGDYAFWHCSNLTSVTIGNGVTSIGDDAFYYCDGLTSVTIGNGVTSIGSDAFAYCSDLTSVTIPDSVTSIGSDAFAYCSDLTSVIIGNGVTSIGSDAFSDCYDLTSVTFEETSGWFVSESSSATSGTDISADRLSNKSTAAQFLRSGYSNYYWKRNA